ncbi:Uncharacterised protein [Staphylococcus aureus]|nr:Uncharacterised protein [Staphylococcus aureus]
MIDAVPKQIKKIIIKYIEKLSVLIGSVSIEK